jgi:hypothetical protein
MISSIYLHLHACIYYLNIKIRSKTLSCRGINHAWGDGWLCSGHSSEQKDGKQLILISFKKPKDTVQKKKETKRQIHLRNPSRTDPDHHTRRTTSISSKNAEKETAKESFKNLSKNLSRPPLKTRQHRPIQARSCVTATATATVVCVSWNHCDAIDASSSDANSRGIWSSKSDGGGGGGASADIGADVGGAFRGNTR